MGLGLARLEICQQIGRIYVEEGREEADDKLAFSSTMRYSRAKR